MILNHRKTIRSVISPLCSNCVLIQSQYLTEFLALASLFSLYTYLLFFLYLFRKTVFQPMQNIIHVNLSIALLLSLILFVSGIETANENRVSIYNAFTIYILYNYWLINMQFFESCNMMS